MKAFLLKLTSRKFLLALSGFIACVATGNMPGAVAIVLAYLGVEGAIDHNVGK
jgi:hypothetical protein